MHKLTVGQGESGLRAQAGVVQRRQCHVGQHGQRRAVSRAVVGHTQQRVIDRAPRGLREADIVHKARAAIPSVDARDLLD